MADESVNLVFIHGMYLNGASWAPWVARASARGYTCHAPSWPHHAGLPADLRAHVEPGLGALTFAVVVDHLKAFIDTLPQRPVLVGHSIGGLAVQKLVNDGYASAGVSISSAPPRGIVSVAPSFVRANFPHVNPLAGNTPVLMTPKRFRYTFCNTMSVEDTAEAFERYVVPESRNVPRSTLTSQARIDFRTPHAPLLFLAGDSDHLTPLAMIKKNVGAYRDAGGPPPLKEFAGRSHFICNQDGWEDVADHALDWIGTHRPPN
jgi:alpha-beta hydrolase superfamily lysophospholipase